MFNIAQNRRWYFLVSALVIVPGIAFMIYSTVTTGAPVQLSIDFRGGSLFVITFADDASEEAIRDVYTGFGFDDPQIQQLGDDADHRWQVRSNEMTPGKQADLLDALEADIAPIVADESTFDVVAPSIGTEVTRAGLWAVLAAAIVITGFIWFAFRSVSFSWRYGVSAILAMVHDVLIMLSAMSIMGLFFGWQADALFVTAVLTVVGYSVQDSIVVFDRIRENLLRRRSEDYDTVVNRSVLETIHRSLATQINAMFIMTSILLFGGATIKQFIAILLIGLLSGTYSSIFTAVPLLVSWQKGELPFSRSRA